MPGFLHQFKLLYCKYLVLVFGSFMWCPVQIKKDAFNIFFVVILTDLCDNGCACSRNLCEPKEYKSIHHTCVHYQLDLLWFPSTMLRGAVINGGVKKRSWYVLVIRRSQTSGSILMNLLMNGKDSHFGYQLQPVCRDVSCSSFLMNIIKVYKVTSCLENLEMSGNLTTVRKLTK